MNLENKKKITHLIYSGLGGASKIGIEIVKNFSKKKNIENTIIFNGVENLFSDYLNSAKKLKVKYIFLRIFRKKFLKNLILILSKLKKERPDVIISHEIGLLSIFFFKIFIKVKVITVMHTPYKSLKQILNFLLILAVSDKIVFVTKKKDVVYKIFSFLTSRTIIIENGIKIKKLNKTEPKNFIIGKAIRFVDQKKPELIVDLCNLYKEFLIKNKITFSIAGNGPKFNQFKTLIKKNKLQKLIKLEGYLSNIKLEKWYTKLSLFVNFSSSENLSISILEAMSVPLPAIVTNLKSNEIICKKKFYGYKTIIFTENDPVKIYKYIMKLYKNKKLRNKISKSAYKNVSLYYSSQIMSEKYYKLI